MRRESARNGRRSTRLRRWWRFVVGQWTSERGCSVYCAGGGHDVFGGRLKGSRFGCDGTCRVCLDGGYACWIMAWFQFRTEVYAWYFTHIPFRLQDES